MVIFTVWTVSILLEQKKLKHIKKVCENKDFCHAVMPSEDTTILKSNQYQKSDQAPFIIYADVVCLIERTDGCKNNPEDSSTTKVGEHIPSDFQYLQYRHLKA